MKSKRRTLCPYPFMHQYISSTGTVSPCCHAYDKGKFTDPWRLLQIEQGLSSNVHRTMRKQMQANIWPEICTKCKIQEDKGEKSHRMIAWERFGFPKTKKVTYLDIAFTNTCNLACRMCKPSDSSLLQELYAFEGDKPSWIDRQHHEWDFMPERKVKYVKKLITEGLQLLKVTGGEPFACKYFLEVVNWAVENDYAKNLSIDLTTNGTKINKVLINKLLKFKSVKLLFSIDGHGSVYNYIRHHSDWDKVYANLKKVTEHPSIEVHASCVLQFYNTTNIKDLVVDCAKIGVPVYPDEYIKPPTIEIVPYHIDDNIASIIMQHVKELDELAKEYRENDNGIQFHIDKTIKTLYNIVEHERPSKKTKKRLKQTIQIQDRLYNTNYEDYLLPEQIAYLKEI